MTVATISTKGQITLPAAARRAIGIKPHDRVIVEVKDNAISVRSAPDLFKLKGFLGKGVSRDKERIAMMQHVAQHARKTS
jgi:AbrB family looped-hinge helix DNA binding protein